MIDKTSFAEIKKNIMKIKKKANRKTKIHKKEMYVCEDVECDCDDCCATSSRGPQGMDGYAASIAVGPQGFAGSDFIAPNGPQGSQGIECQCDPAMMQGPQGDIGPQAEISPGYQGFLGPQGISEQGPPGSQGFAGVQGAQGRLGFTGARGFQGESGGGLSFRGAQGSQGFTQGGVPGTRGPQGASPTHLNGMFVGSNPISFTLKTNGIIASLMPPAPGRFLYTICFNPRFQSLAPGWVQLVFEIVQSGTLASTRFTMSAAQSLLQFDVRSDDITGTIPFIVRFTGSSAMTFYIFEFVATYIQL